MGKIKLVVLDLDGTLLTDDVVIEPEAKTVIKRVMEKGIGVTIATGRMYLSTRAFAGELGLKLPLILYHGAQMRYPEGRIVYQRTVPLPLAKRLIEIVRRFGYAYNVYLDDRLFVEKVLKENREYAGRAGIELHCVGDMLTFLREEPLKIVALRDGPQLNPLEEALRREIGEDIYLTRSLPHYLEMLSPYANKAYGLEKLSAMEGIAREEIMAVGDSYNDIQMLRYAGIGVAMGNAPETVKAEADYVTCSNNEGGVARALEKYLL